MTDWCPSASIGNLKLRAQIINKIRNFLQARQYLEVETPIMAQHGVTDRYLSNIKAQFRNKTYYLQTSPEYHMKRLLAAGSGPIFQISKVFRDDELGHWHNPEFTLLEWYQLDIDHHELMTEVGELLVEVIGAAPLIKISYQELFMEYCNLDPFSSSVNDFKNCLKKHNLENTLKYDETDCDQFLFLLLTHVIEPELKNITAPLAIYDFPPSQASLAQINNGVANRFEIYYKGIELANGFHELSDAAKQLQRFNSDNDLRSQANIETMTPDPYLLAALEHGLPSCSGVALGVDRLIALALQETTIAEVLAFTINKA